MKTVKFLALGICASLMAVLPLNAATTGHFERTLQVSGTVELEVSSGSGNINVHQGGPGTVSVTAKIHGNNGTSWLFGSGNIDERIHKIEQNPPIVQTGNSIHIGRFEDRDLSRNISIDYDVTVPPQTRLTSHTGSGDQTISGLQLPMTAKTGSGNITVERIAGETRVSSGSGDLKINSVKGVLYADTGSGNIRANDIAGDVFVNTGSGDIEVRQSAGGSAKAQTGSGNIRLDGVKGGLRADAGSGNIQAQGEPTSDWRLGAGSGNITLKVPTQASFNLDARTSSGTLRFNSHQVTTQGTLAKNHIQGKVGKWRRPAGHSYWIGRYRTAIKNFMFAPPFSGLQQILKAEQPFMAVQSKAEFVDSAIIESYDWHCRDGRAAISSSYGCHLKTQNCGS